MRCSVAKLCLTLRDPVDCSMPGFPVLHYHPEFAQTHVHWVGDAIQPSYSLLSPSPAFNLSQNQGLFKWVSSPNQMAKYWSFSFSISPSSDTYIKSNHWHSQSIHAAYTGSLQWCAGSSLYSLVRAICSLGFQTLPSVALIVKLTIVGSRNWETFKLRLLVDFGFFVCFVSLSLKI